MKIEGEKRFNWLYSTGDIFIMIRKLESYV